MSDIVSIELLLDEATEAAVRGEWDALAAAGLSSLAAHTAESNRPHITVIARTSPVAPAVREAAESLPIPLTLGAPLLFGAGERRVLVRSVVPSAALLALHAKAHQLAGPGDDVPHSLPGEWMPHVTLARRVSLTTMAQALELVGGELRGAAVGLRRWDAASRTVETLA